MVHFFQRVLLICALVPALLSCDKFLGPIPNEDYVGPRVVETFPAQGQTVSTGPGEFRIVFSKNMEYNSFHVNTVDNECNDVLGRDYVIKITKLENKFSGPNCLQIQAGTEYYDDWIKTYRFQFSAALETNTWYKIKIMPQIRDQHGNALGYTPEIHFFVN